MASQLGSAIHAEDDLFYFESDHLALKGNKDYSEVLKTLVILSAQREQALKDITKVSELKKKYLANPNLLLEKIENGEDLGIPPLLELPKLPVINLQKYGAKISDNDIKLIYSNENHKKSEDKLISDNGKSTKKWTVEDQKRLEELLIKYPPEPIEKQRYEKIAKAMGNKTAQQVTSRVQKYFIKLFKAGLPIPGRIPKSGEKYKKSVLHKHQRHNHYLWKPTTFFPSLNVPVVMNELENIPGPSSASISSSNSSNYLLPSSTYHSQPASPQVKHEAKSDKELQLELLYRIKDVKLKEQQPDYDPFPHIGFKCDYCDEDPINGTRWHCSFCTESIDFCTDCLVSQLYSENRHPLSHHFITFHTDTCYSGGSFEMDGLSQDAMNKFDDDNDSSENDEDMEDDESASTEDLQLNGYLNQDIKQEIKTEDGYESSTSSNARKLEEDFDSLSRGNNSFSLNDVDNIFEGM